MNRLSANRTTRGVSRNAFLLLAMVPAISFAGDLPKEFTLGRYIPEDVWMYVHHASNPERAWIDDAWSDVFEAAKDSGVIGDLASMLCSSMDADNEAKAREGLEKATRLVNAVNWSALTAKEYVFAERMAACCVGYDYIFLVRGEDGSGQANFKAISSIMEELAVLAGSKVVVKDIGGTTVHSLAFNSEELKSRGFTIELIRKGDILGIVTGQKSLTDVIGLLAGKPQIKSITQNKRFTEAITNVPAPRDEVAYYDIKRFVGDFDTMLEKIPQLRDQMAKHGKARNGTAKNKKESPMRALRVVIREVDIVDYVVSTTTTEGMKEWNRSYTRLQDGASKKGLAKAFLHRKPFKKFDRFIPVNALGFSLSASVDFEQLFKSSKRILTEVEPSIGTKVAGVEAKLAEMGLDLQKDVFDWLSGESINIEIPAAMVTPMSQSDQVLMLRVKDSKLAAMKIKRGINKLAELMQNNGQMLMVTPAPVSAQGFTQVTHPLLAMMFRPVIGVYEDWLILGTSAAGINACLAVASGNAPSIATNERFIREGLSPAGDVRSVSFKNTSNWGSDAAKTVTMIGAFGPMALAGVPEENAEQRKVKAMITNLLGFAAKVGPVLQMIDFYSSEASVSVYDGDRTLRCESLVTYKKTTAPPKPSEPVLTRKPVK